MIDLSYSAQHSRLARYATVLAFAFSPQLAAAATEQLAEGKAIFAKQCATCHHQSLRGTAHGTKLRGMEFLTKWAGRTSNDVLATVSRTMPPGGGANLSPQQYLAVVAHIMDANELLAKDIELSKDSAVMIGAAGTEALDSWSDAGLIAEVAKTRSGFLNRKIKDFRPVSSAELANPADQDWLSWRRTLDGQAHSPLDQINKDNVESLTLAWSLAMHDGSNQVTPLVRDGIMFLTHAANMIQALDATNGELIWEYRYPYPEASRTLAGPVRNIALYEDKLFMATYDAAIVAIDVRTGEQLWRTEKADYRLGYTHTSGPIIGDGVVLSGINGCELFKEGGCFITGHDAQTGEELWRTSTIALPGEPGGDTWAGIPLERRAGADSWIAGSYDPQLKLFYIGTAQAKPWVAASRNMSTEDAALYSNSTLALNPKTGELVWYYQHIPGETIDMEVGFERVLVDDNDQKMLLTVGKDGILWKLDRRDGTYIDLTETMAQNIFKQLNRKTGQVVYRDDIREAGIGDKISACPGIYGGHNWQAMAYSPQIRSLIIPLHQICSELAGREVDQSIGGGGFGGDSRSYAVPGKEGSLGKLVAYDVRTMSEVWSHEQNAIFMTGVLTTGSGLAFVGDLDRYFKAFDVNTGKVVWDTRVGAPTHGFPITYSVKGKQYVAVPTGMGVFRASTAIISSDIYQPSNGQALYVFSLPD
ncbi:MAG: PQQ-binding-like beta-propeller repeat protein [Halioglobus sp.]